MTTPILDQINNQNNMKTAKEFRMEIPSTLDRILKEVQYRTTKGNSSLDLYGYIHSDYGDSFYYPTFNYNDTDLDKLKELGFKIKTFQPNKGKTKGFLFWKKPAKNENETYYSISW